MLTGVTSVSELIVTFLQLILVANSCVLLFSARISVTHFFRRRQRWGN